MHLSGLADVAEGRNCEFEDVLIETLKLKCRGKKCWKKKH